MPSGCQPFLTRRFELALQFASGLHHSQCRKGTPIPYISHLMAVSALVLEAGGDEDVAIAELLHDAVEDQGGAPLTNYPAHVWGSGCECRYGVLLTFLISQFETQIC